MGKCGSKNRSGPVDRLGKDYDYLAGAGSSGFGSDYNRNGGYGYGDYGLQSSCPEGVNQNTALLATAAAIAVGAGVIYRAVTLQQGKRRKREVGGDGGMLQDRLMDLIVLGMENFEERVNEQESKGEYVEGDTWTNKVLRDFSKYKAELEKEMEEEISDTKMISSDLEPPLLDPIWGLEVQTSTLGVGNDDGEDMKKEDFIIEERCKVKVWRCLSKVMELGVKQIEKPGGLWSLVRSLLYKTAFRGQQNSVWSSVMGLPQVGTDGVKLELFLVYCDSMVFTSCFRPRPLPGV